MTQEFTVTNISTYKDIAVEHYLLMIKEMRSNRRPIKNGENGWVLNLDPKRKSFKSAMITIVFVGMWLDAALHQLIVSMGKNSRKVYNMNYEEKLILIGINDPLVIEKVKWFRESRNDLIHEKAFKKNGLHRIA